MEALRIGTIIASCIMALGTILFWAFTPQLLQIFNASAELLEIGIPALRIISLCFIPAAVGILFSTLFQALGMGMRSLIMSVMRQLVVLLPCAWWLACYGVNYVWMSFPIAEAVSLVVCIGLFVQLYRAHIRDMESKNALVKCVKPLRMDIKAAATLILWLPLFGFNAVFYPISFVL